MSKRVSWEVKAKAFHLYCIGLTQEKIAEELKVNRWTVTAWVKKYDWSESHKELEKLASEKATKTTKDTQLLIIKSIYALYAEKNQDPAKRDKLIDELRISDVLHAIEKERLIEGMSTENIAIQEKKTISLEDFEKAVKKLQEK